MGWPARSPGAGPGKGEGGPSRLAADHDPPKIGCKVLPRGVYSGQVIGMKRVALARPLWLLLLGGLAGCSTTYPNREPVGEFFPRVAGETLEGRRVALPDHFAGRTVVVLLGYRMESQFDIDRWLIGLDMTGTEAEVYELPPIAGLFPRFFKPYIDEGMRKGIPKELWKGVITIYAGGAEVQEFTGNENPNNARALVLDPAGKVVFFHDRGFSVAALNALRAEVAGGVGPPQVACGQGVGMFSPPWEGPCSRFSGPGNRLQGPHGWMVCTLLTGRPAGGRRRPFPACSRSGPPENWLQGPSPGVISGQVIGL